MRRRVVILGVLFSLVLLSVGGGASADSLFTPGLTVLSAADATLIELAVPTGPSTAAATFYVPPGYGVTLTQPATTQVGVAIVFAGGQLLEGNITAADPAALAATPEGQACDPGTHAAAWSLSVTVGGQTLDIPFFIDPTTGTDTALGTYEIHTCFASAQFGSTLAAIGDLSMIFQGVFTAPGAPGDYLWHALVTPYQADGATPNTLGVKDYQANEPLPASLTMTKKYNAKTHVVTIGGKLSLAGQAPPPGVRIDLMTETSPTDLLPTLRARPGTAADGSFHASFRLTRTMYVAASPETYHPACTTTEPGGCLQSVTTGASALVHVVVKKPAKKKR